MFLANKSENGLQKTAQRFGGRKSSCKKKKAIWDGRNANEGSANEKSKI